MHMQPAQLGAAVQFGEDLAGIEQAVGIEGAFDALLLRQVGLVEHRGHEVALFHADPARPSARRPQQSFRMSAPKGLGALQLARLVGIVEDQRMEIAVAGMEHICDRRS
jgi:hypothetical protein